MKRLYLMRHGHSPTSAEAGIRTDALRPLSDRGRKDAAAMAGEIRRRGGRPSLILHSPLLRAVQTAAAAAGALEVPAEVFVPLDNTRAADEVLEMVLERADAAEEVLAIGHQPQIGEIADLLAEAAFEFRPAGLVAVEWAPKPRLLWALNADELVS